MLEMKRCNNCGYIGEEGNFCPSCGGSLSDVTEQQEPSAEYQPSVSQMPEQMNGYYQPPVVQKPQEEMTLGNWMVTLLLAAIPCVNLIMLFVWGFGSNTPRSKANWARATLIFTAIGIVLLIIYMVVMGVAFGSLFYNSYYY